MKETRAEHLAVEKLRPFDGHPFKVVDNEEMDQLVWSILTQGLQTLQEGKLIRVDEDSIESLPEILHAYKHPAVSFQPHFLYCIVSESPQ